VSLIPSPKRYYRQFLRGEVTDGWRRHLRWIIGVMLERGKISQAEYMAAAPYSPVFRGRAKKPDIEAPDTPPPPLPWDPNELP
jgi:membrane peptidoglycan carboxypeptidase